MKLEADIKKLEEEISSNINNIDDEKLDTLVQRKINLLSLEIKELKELCYVLEVGMKILGKGYQITSLI